MPKPSYKPRNPNFDPDNPYADWAEAGDASTSAPPKQELSEGSGKRKEPVYYWLKLKDGFFDSKYIKALRARANGDRMAIVYLSMQLKALKTNGILKYSEVMPSYEEELALELNEDVEVIKSTLANLEQLNLVEIWDDKSVYMVCKQELLDYGSETAAAERMRAKRSRDKQA